MGLTAISYRGYDHREVILPVHEMLQRAAERPWDFPYPYPLLKAMVETEIEGQKDHQHGEGYVSATSVQAPCLRCAILKNNMDYTESVDELYPRFAGTRAHSIIEEHPYPNSINELRLAITTPYGKVTGKFDILKLHGDGAATLMDLKNSKEPPRYDKPKYWHALQGQTYRYIINHADEVLSGPVLEAAVLLGGGAATPDAAKAEILAGLHELRIEHISFIYAMPGDMKVLELRKNVEVPTKTKGAKYPTRNDKQPDIWTDEQVEEMLFPKVKAYLEAEQMYRYEGVLPPYPDNVKDPVAWTIHRNYTPSGVANACVRAHYEDLRSA